MCPLYFSQYIGQHITDHLVCSLCASVSQVSSRKCTHTHAHTKRFILRAGYCDLGVPESPKSVGLAGGWILR